MNTIEQFEPVLQKKQTEITEFMAGALVVEIKDQAGYDKAVDLNKEIIRRIDDLEDERKSITGPLNAVIKTVNDKFKLVSEPLLKFKEGIKRLCLDYGAEQERIRLEAQRKADEIARKERERIEAEARAQREKEEAARKAEEEARRLAAAEQDAEKRKALEKEAEKRRKEAEAAAAKAETKEMISAQVVAPIVAPKMEKRGFSSSDKWAVTVTDKKAFILSCLEKGTLEYLDINVTMLTKEACSTKGVRSWPGIKTEVYKATAQRK